MLRPTRSRRLIGAVAELERSLTRERQREGIDLAKARGAYKGRARRLIYDVIAGNGAYGDSDTLRGIKTL